MPLTYVVRFGGDLGIELRPHRYKTGYRASESKHGRHVHVHTEAELIPYLKRGWSVRMGAPGHPPSLVRPDSINGWR